MHRQQFAINAIVFVALVMSLTLLNAGITRAQTPEAPLLPMNVAFRYVPHYFEQSVSDDPRYARIEALLDKDGCDVIVLDKTTNREAFYSTSTRKVDARAANGGDAYLTAIESTPPADDATSPRVSIHFRDHFGNEVSWSFVVGEIVPHAQPEVISRTDTSAIIFLYAPRRASSADGTLLKIAGRDYLPKSKYSDGVSAFYAMDMTLAEILPGTDLWEVEGSPTDKLTDKWSLAGAGGRLRTLTLKARSEKEASIDQIDLSEPDAPQITLDVVGVNDSYELRSVSFETHFNTLWIFFGPPLPLPARETDDQRLVTFTVAENEQASIATGELEVRRAAGAEHVLWRFETPSFAKAISFETGVNLIPGARAQETCIRECLDLLR